MQRDPAVFFENCAVSWGGALVRLKLNRNSGSSSHFWLRGPLDFTVAGALKLAYAVLQFFVKRAQCFARVCLAGPEAFCELTPLDAVLCGGSLQEP